MEKGEMGAYNSTLKLFINSTLSNTGLRLNGELAIFLSKKQNVRELLFEFFDEYNVRKYRLRTFELRRWCHTKNYTQTSLLLVEVEKQIKIGVLSNDILLPLGLKIPIFTNEMEIIISDFFSNPLVYFMRNYIIFKQNQL